MGRNKKRTTPDNWEEEKKRIQPICESYPGHVGNDPDVAHLHRQYFITINSLVDLEMKVTVAGLFLPDGPFQPKTKNLSYSGQLRSKIDGGNYVYSVVMHSMMFTNRFDDQHWLGDATLGDVIEAVLAVGSQTVTLTDEELEDNGVELADITAMAILFNTAVTLASKIQKWSKARLDIWEYSVSLAYILQTCATPIQEESRDADTGSIPIPFQPGGRIV